MKVGFEKRRSRTLIGALGILVMIGMMFGSLAPASAASTGSETAGELSRQEASAVAEALNADSQEFLKTVSILEESASIQNYLAAYPEFDSHDQLEVLALGFSPEAAQAFVQLLDSGELVISADRDSDGSPAPTMEAAAAVDVSSGPVAVAAAGFPQCPSAWAALYAWFATEAAFCGALGFFGPGAALGCAAAMTLLGTIPDYNAGC